MSFSQYFDTNIISSSIPDPLGPAYVWWLIAFGVILVLGIIAKISIRFKKNINPYKRRMMNRVFQWCLSFGLLGLAHTLAQETQVRFIGARLVILIVGLVWLIWAVRILVLQFFTARLTVLVAAIGSTFLHLFF